ncbi:TlpA family protein disulfide reductase [Angelakisella massiliensis]|uniref:TlpA family protein disulfide reductase n=1 Tax=Angelakisella massiliensis TaxID=1871018 RepID=UPI0023A84827|nr:TlpA disulfide reductase family protein [Angelakisella massiliensis]
MKNHRRRLSFVAVAMALALMLGACGGQTASSSSQQSDAQSTSPSAPSQEASEESGSQEESSVAEVTPVFGETFTSEDLEGNAVDQTIFEGHDLTMVNIWATFCGPCLDEMPDLGELNTQYADQNFQIVGIVVDVLNQDLTYNEEQVALAKEVVEKTGASYTHLLPSTDLLMNKLIYVTGVPETVFVDSEGNQVGESYLGARSKEEWSEIIEELLAEVQG